MRKAPLFAAASLAAAIGAPAAFAQSDTVVVDVRRLFDGTAVQDQARLVLRDGRVVAVGPRDKVNAPKGARRVDLSGRYVIPGLIAAHSHVGMVRGVDGGSQNYDRQTVAENLTQFQRYGVVAVNALGMNGPLFHDIRREWREAPPSHADLYGAGGGVGAVEGAPPATMKPPSTLNRPRTPEEARAAVDQMADAGVDMIKVWVDSLSGRAPRMPPEIYQAAIDQAHARGLKAAAHIHDLSDAKALIRAGVDIIGHGVRDVPVDAEFIDLLKARQVWYVATVNINEAEYIYAEHPEWLDDPFFRMALNPQLEERLRDPKWREEALARSATPRKAVATNLANLRALHEAGVKIAFGTDSGATFLRIPGFAEHLELGHMVAAGMTPTEALTVATANSARMIGAPDRGCLKIGCRADFVVLTADPTTDIANSRKIETVWRRGAPVEAR